MKQDEQFTLAKIVYKTLGFKWLIKRSAPLRRLCWRIVT